MNIFAATRSKFETIRASTRFGGGVITGECRSCTRPNTWNTIFSFCASHTSHTQWYMYIWMGAFKPVRHIRISKNRSAKINNTLWHSGDIGHWARIVFWPVKFIVKTIIITCIYAYSIYTLKYTQASRKLLMIFGPGIVYVRRGVLSNVACGCQAMIVIGTRAISIFSITRMTCTIDNRIAYVHWNSAAFSIVTRVLNRSEC